VGRCGDGGRLLAEEAAAKALFGLALAASAAGGAVGAKMWPKDDVVLERTRATRT